MIMIMRNAIYGALFEGLEISQILLKIGKSFHQNFDISWAFMVFISEYVNHYVFP